MRAGLLTAALALTAIGAGVALAVLQQWNIGAGWNACFSGIVDGNGNVHSDPAAYLDAGESFASAAAAVTRLVG